MIKTARTTAVLLAILCSSGCAPRVKPLGAGSIYKPDKSEQRLWDATREDSNLLAASGFRHKDERLDQYLQEVLDRLLGEHLAAYVPLRPRVFVIDEPKPNAFAYPHGDIFIHTGMLGRLRNEAQLAMLLGHEITHATHRHTFQTLESAYARTGANAYISVLSVAGGANIQRALSGLSNVITIAGISGYRRDKEEEADKVGLTLMAQAGYDPKDGTKMFQRMLEATDPKERRWNFFYATHPKMKSRTESCDRLVERLHPEVRSSALDLGQDRYLDAALPLIHDEVERHITQGKFELAEATIRFLGEARPNDAATHAYLGDLRRARAKPGDDAGAREAYLKALSLNANHPPAHRGLGLLCGRMGQKAEAAEHLQKYVDLTPDAPDADFVRQNVARFTEGH